MTTDINLVVNTPENISFALDKKAYNLDFDTKIVTVGGEPYTGSYTVTPTQQTQTLYTASKTMASNVTINPIPSNYGLITWNGSVLTVS